MRIRLDLGYDGSAFSGWAAQPGLRTIEGELSRGLTILVRSPRPVRLTVAGRTDAGVHARGQVVHADIEESGWERVPGRSERSPEEAAVVRLGGLLPPDLVVRSAVPAPDGFNARFSAVSRRYLYRISDQAGALDPLRRHDTVVVKSPLDADAMDAASRDLLGLGDFAAFCRPREGATTIRTLLEFSWERLPDGVVVGTVVADAFCHSMVRSLVGAMVRVGEGRYAADFPAEVMASRLRDARMKVMPAHGLSLEEVVYPPDAEMSARAEETRTRRALSALP